MSYALKTKAIQGNDLISEASALLGLSVGGQAVPYYVQANALSSGRTCFGSDSALRGGDTGQLQQTAISINRTTDGSTTLASANLEAQELKVRTVGDGFEATNRAGAIFMDTYYFEPLVTPTEVNFAYSFDGRFSNTTLDPIFTFVTLTTIIWDSTRRDILLLETVRLLDFFDGTYSTNGSGLIEHVLNLDVGISSLEITMDLNAQELEGAIIDSSNTVDYSIDFSDDFSSISRASGLPVTPIASAPEPSSLALFGLGLAGLGISRRK